MNTVDNSSAGKPERRPRFFYGWVIVAVCVFTGINQAGVLNPLLSLFMKPMSDEFGWSRAQFSGGVLFATVGGGILALLIGQFLDKRGLKLVMIIGSAVIGLSVAALSTVKQLSQFYAYFGIGRSVMAGGTMLAISVVVTNWFLRKRGRAMAIAMAGSAGGSALLPFLANWWISSHDWRFAWLMLGIVLTFIGVIPVLLLRHRPEDMGLYPDGEAPSAASRKISRQKKTPATPRPETTWTRRAFLKTPVFWMVALTESAGSMGFAAINMHQFPCLTDVGIPTAIALSTVSITSTCAIFSSLAWGLLAEKISGRWCAVLVLLCHAMSATLLIFARNIPMAYIFSVVWGISMGGLLAVFSVVWAEYFGRPSQGLVRGTSIPLRLFGNAFGPLWVGMVYDSQRSYYLAFWTLAAIFIAGAFIMFLSRAPVRAAATAATRQAL